MARPHLDIGPLDPATAEAVRRLAADAERADGVAPLGEQTLLRLDSDAATLTHLVAVDGGVVGYGQVDRGGSVASAEIVVAPSRRREGIGRMLLRTARRDAGLPAHSGEPGGLPLRVWAHGDLPAARALAAAEGLTPVRELLFLARRIGSGDAAAAGGSSTAPAGGTEGSAAGGAPELPPGLAVRAFRPGVDDAAWLAVNARAFASHPEQGRLGPDDLAARMAEPWFDASGFLLAWEGEEIAGFVWTKIEPGNPADGEIYVVGVDPAHQGRGLGGALTAAGIAHIAQSGAKRVTLYVDGDNTAALRTYDRAGFERAAVDVQYGVPESGGVRSE